MVRAPSGWGSLGMAVGWCLVARPVRSQQPVDTGKVYHLPPVTVSVTRTDLPFSQTPLAVQLLDKSQIGRGRPTWGLDESLAAVPGVFVANRYNFSLDQRISIRGFGSRSAFAVRGVKILLDGIPQTLPDGQGQLTNVELGAADHVEVLRGSASALFGNAAGGVISIWTDPTAPQHPSSSLAVTLGRFDRNGRTWSKWLASASERVAGGGAYVTVSRLNYNGERDHSAADFRNLNARVQLPLGPSWSLSLLADAGIDPRADNPGAVTLAGLQANRDSAPPANVNLRAGKDVTQLQGGATVRHQIASGGEDAFTVFGLGRTLRNPTTFAYIDLDRSDYGVRAQVARPLPLGRFAQRVTAGFDFQRQRDDRINFNNVGGQPDTTRQLDQLEHVTEVGPFVQSAVVLNPRTTVTAGLRYDWVDFRVHDRLVDSINPDDSGRRLMAALSGSLGVAVNPAPAVTLYANVGSSFETPTTTELTNRPDTAGGFNPTLQPQKAWNYEMGARGVVGGRLAYSLALFQADVRGELISYPDSLQRVFYRNAGSARHRGIELGGDVKILPGMSATASWTYADYRYVRYTFVNATSTFVLDGRALPGIPRTWLRLALQARPAVLRGAWLEYEESYSSAYYVDDTLSVRTSPWWAANLRVGWEGTAGTLRIAPFLGVNNLYNRLYVGSVTINGARGRYYEPAPARNAYVGFSLGAAH